MGLAWKADSRRSTCCSILASAGIASEHDTHPVRLGAIILEKLPLLVLSIVAGAIASVTRGRIGRRTRGAGDASYRPAEPR